MQLFEEAMDELKPFDAFVFDLPSVQSLLLCCLSPLDLIIENQLAGRRSWAAMGAYLARLCDVFAFPVEHTNRGYPASV